MKRIITQILLLLFGSYLHAQQQFSNIGNLQIHPGASVTGFGNFANESTGSFVNNGSVYIKGNIINDQSSMATGTGTLYVNGTSGQSVNGTQVFKTYNLVTDNATGITLNNNLSLSGVHTYTSGILATSATTNYLIYEDGSSYSGDGDSRHVNGWVKKIGSTDFSFPVGNGTVIRKAAIESLSGSLEFNCKFAAPTPDPLQVQTPLVLADPNEYWIVNRVNGSGSAQVHLNWDNSKVNFPPYVLNTIKVAYYTAGYWTSQGGSATGDINTTGDVTSHAMASFGSFTFGSEDFVLRLRFLGVTGHHKADHNLIEWRAVSASNADHFEIERSEDGVHFKKIGSAISYNSPSAILNSFKDVRSISGVLWYRVRGVDKTGNFILSNVVSLGEIPANQSMYVLNNPARGSIHLFAPESFKGVPDYYITNSAGQLVQKGIITVNSRGYVFIKLDAAISPGVYIIHVKKGRQHFQERLLVQ